MIFIRFLVENPKKYKVGENNEKGTVSNILIALLGILLYGQ
jgi:hypothetical protein